MRNIISLIAAAVLLLLPAGAGAAKKSVPRQLTADSVFVALKPPVVELLTESARLDMIDYFLADSIVKVSNTMGGKSYIETMTPDYLKARITGVSTLEIRVLPLSKGGDIAAVAYTVDSTGKQADSELFFFDSDMKPIEIKKVFRQPDLKEFFHREKGMKTSEKELLEMVRFPTIEYSFSPTDNTMKGRLTVGEYIDQDDLNILKLFLMPELQWTWDGKKFK